MHFSNILAVAAIFSTAFAAPAPEPAESRNMMAAAAPQWTIQNFKRVNSADSKTSTYTFGIDTKNGQKPTSCNYKVTGNPATRQSYYNIKCGDFVIGSSWSGQFGANQGFQTLSVVRNRQIIYPAYTDKQLASQQVVKPDQSYTPQNLP